MHRISFPNDHAYISHKHKDKDNRTTGNINGSEVNLFTNVKYHTLSDFTLLMKTHE